MEIKSGSQYEAAQSFDKGKERRPEQARELRRARVSKSGSEGDRNPAKMTPSRGSFLDRVDDSGYSDAELLAEQVPSATDQAQHRLTLSHLDGASVGSNHEPQRRSLNLIMLTIVEGMKTD